MTPKEKAEELVDKFKNKSVELGESHSQLLAEANALIAVELVNITEPLYAVTVPLVFVKKQIPLVSPALPLLSKNNPE